MPDLFSTPYWGTCCCMLVFLLVAEQVDVPQNSGSTTSKCNTHRTDGAAADSLFRPANDTPCRPAHQHLHRNRARPEPAPPPAPELTPPPPPETRIQTRPCPVWSPDGGPARPTLQLDSSGARYFSRTIVPLDIDENEEDRNGAVHPPHKQDE